MKTFQYPWHLKSPQTLYRAASNLSLFTAFNVFTIASKLLFSFSQKTNWRINNIQQVKAPITVNGTISCFWWKKNGRNGTGRNNWKKVLFHIFHQTFIYLFRTLYLELLSIHGDCHFFKRSPRLHMSRLSCFRNDF